MYRTRADGRILHQVWGHGDGFLLYPPTRQKPVTDIAHYEMDLAKIAAARKEIAELVDRR